MLKKNKKRNENINPSMRFNKSTIKNEDPLGMMPEIENLFKEKDNKIEYYKRQLDESKNDKRIIEIKLKQVKIIKRKSIN